MEKPSDESTPTSSAPSPTFSSQSTTGTVEIRTHLIPTSPSSDGMFRLKEPHLLRPVKELKNLSYEMESLLTTVTRELNTYDRSILQTFERFGESLNQHSPDINRRAAKDIFREINEDL